MNPPESNDPLDALLREQNPHIDDAGFTARVVSALPRRRSRFGLRTVLLTGAACAGSVLAIYWLPWASLPALSVPALFSMDSQILFPRILVLLVVGSLAWVIVAATQSED